MGVGDWLMATGQVKKMFARNALPVLVVSTGHRPQWNEVFENNPKIVRTPARRHQTLLNASGIRPYIAGKTDTHWRWREFGPEPGELFLSQAEKDFAAPYVGKVLIEPNVKKIGHDNKAWIPSRWQELVQMCPQDYVQCGQQGSRQLRGVQFVETQSFRRACAVLSVCRAFVGTEGGLMHAAAALNVPAVILWSEFIDPSITGYQAHKNIRHAGRPCGSRLHCDRCRDSMREISVNEVKMNLIEVLA